MPSGLDGEFEPDRIVKLFVGIEQEQPDPGASSDDVRDRTPFDSRSFRDGVGSDHVQGQQESAPILLIPGRLENLLERVSDPGRPEEGARGGNEKRGKDDFFGNPGHGII